MDEQKLNTTFLFGKTRLDVKIHLPCLGIDLKAALGEAKRRDFKLFDTTTEGWAISRKLLDNFFYFWAYLIAIE